MDLLLNWSETLLAADLSITSADLATDEGLQTAVIVSLFTDRRAGPDEIPEGDDPRGWWGDAYADDDGDAIGSKLWLLHRSKETPETLRRAKTYAEEALAWLVADGWARKITVTATVPRREVLGLWVVIDRPDGQAARFAFNAFWKGA